MTGHDTSPAFTRWAVLGVLSQAPRLSARDIRRWANGSLRFFHSSLAARDVYAALQHLEETGYVESWIEPVEAGRATRMYRVTEEGADALRRHLRTASFRPRPLRNTVVLRAWLGGVGGGDGFAAAATAYRRHLEDTLDEIGVALASAEADPQFAHAAAALRWSHRVHRAELDALAELCAELASLQVQRTSKAPTHCKPSKR